LKQTPLLFKGTLCDVWGWHVICALFKIVVSVALNNFHKQLPRWDQSLHS
jgi:hypothetical protein